MRAIAEDRKFTIAEQAEGAPDERGWYHHSVGVADTPEGLVAVYRRTDSHTAVISDIMCARSTDGGRTWVDHRLVAHSDVWNQHALWVAPQLSRLRDGRLVILCDFGHRTTKDDWPMLAQWQTPARGMRNFLFWSSDHGRSWQGPEQIDDVGGEPGYLCELSDGTLLYPRTESAMTDAVWNPPQPWGQHYYRCVVACSDDGGRHWDRSATLSDDPLQGDCEVGLAEVAPQQVLALSRIGFGAGRFGQPSRLLSSRDGGRTWGGARLTPIYAQRPILRRLRSGRLLVTYRNWWGTPGSCALVFDPAEVLPYQPASFIWDEGCCVLRDGVMSMTTREGRAHGVSFTLYPAQAPDSRVEIEADLRVEQADRDGCQISAGCWVRFAPDWVGLGERPDAGFALDASRWHHYRLVRDEGTITIAVDGAVRLRHATAGIETRMVQFGNRPGPAWTGPLHGRPGGGPVQVRNASYSEWRSLSASVRNRQDHSIDWSWDARDGFPDQFRRDRVVRLDRNGSFSPGNSGYSGWTQRADGSIVIVDYTCGDPPTGVPFARAYLTSEEELAG